LFKDKFHRPLKIHRHFSLALRLRPQQLNPSPLRRVIQYRIVNSYDAS
jgi:hypothetical protein